MDGDGGGGAQVNSAPALRGRMAGENFISGLARVPLPIAEQAWRDSHETAKAALHARDMLQPMGQAATASKESSFAGLMASFAARPQTDAEPRWIDDGLEDDVAVLSYEGALKMPAEKAPASSEAAPTRSVLGAPKPPRPERNPDWKNSEISARPQKLTITEVDGPQRFGLEKNLKQASVTIRVSEAECAKLRARAAESGMTVSAYLRSCAFEVESLRAQVKAALAQMRTPAEEKAPAGVPRRTLLQRVARAWPQARAGQQGA